VKNQTTDNLQTFFNGNLWIITRRKKTNTEPNVRLLGIPKRIIEKYKGLTNDNGFAVARRIHRNRQPSLGHEHKNHADIRQDHCPEDKSRHGIID